MMIIILWSLFWLNVIYIEFRLHYWCTWMVESVFVQLIISKVLSALSMLKNPSYLMTTSEKHDWI